jgi:hypothetical protein
MTAISGRRRALLATKRLRRELAALTVRRPAELVVEQLRTFAARHGRHLGHAQQHVLHCCERVLGLPQTPDPRPLIDVEEEIDDET